MYSTAAMMTTPRTRPATTARMLLPIFSSLSNYIRSNDASASLFNVLKKLFNCMKLKPSNNGAAVYFLLFKMAAAIKEKINPNPVV